MLKVKKSRDIISKKDGKEYHILEVEDENGNIAINVFTQQACPVGSYLAAEPYIYDYKVRFNLRPIANNK